MLNHAYNFHDILFKCVFKEEALALTWSWFTLHLLYGQLIYFFFWLSDLSDLR